MATRAVFSVSIMTSLFSSAFARGAWNPVPPCAVPANIVAPAVNETMCSNTIVPAPADNSISIRQYGLPYNETLINVVTASSTFWPSVLSQALPQIFGYFEGQNDEERVFIQDRAGPAATRVATANNSNAGYVTSLLVSTVAFPDSFKIPNPIVQQLFLERVGFRTFGVIQFNTTSYPEKPDFEEACGALTVTLPSGYALNVSSSWTPTWVVYNGEVGGPGGLWTNECWVEVTQA